MRAKAAAVAMMATAALGVGATAAGAAGPPPPPTAPGGQTVTQVAAGLKTPTSFAFGAGKVFEGDGGNTSGNKPPNGGVYLLSGGQGVKLAGSPEFVSGLAWQKGALYIAGGSVTKKGPVFQLQRWSGFNGTTFAKRTVIYTAPKGFDGFNGIAFAPNGRLYVGVDLGLTDGNDHGPATTSPFLYDILTFRADGQDMRVFAKGIRQPWQFAFQAGSNAPFVTDLGQDSGAKNPPDFVLHVHFGDNYGFPVCNQKVAAKCRGFTQPYRRFTAHTDLMGIALSAGTLYLTSFSGPGGKGPGGEVFTLGLTSRALKPLLKGFVAPTVGLGLHWGYLYVGELNGQVFRVRV
jgi:glucose/arabinose dehydrogenase